MCTFFPPLYEVWVVLTPRIPLPPGSAPADNAKMTIAECPTYIAALGEDVTVNRMYMSCCKEIIVRINSVLLMAAIQVFQLDPNHQPWRVDHIWNFELCYPMPTSKFISIPRMHAPKNSRHSVIRNTCRGKPSQNVSTA